MHQEGEYSIMYGTRTLSLGTGYRSAYLSRPDQSGRFPTVLILSDRTGVDSAEKQLGFHLARQGIATIGIELDSSSGEIGTTDLQPIDDLYLYLTSEDLGWVQTPGVGLLGIGEGGSWALSAALYRDWVAALGLLSFPLESSAGNGQETLERLKEIRVPVLSMYGEQDRVTSPKLIDQAQENNPTGVWLRYQGAGAGFFDLGAEDYHWHSDRDAQYRLTRFYATHLPQLQLATLG